MSYPKRPTHYAHKYVRLIGKMCVANEIGTEAFTLLVIIAHTEDAKRYSGAVTWYNEQLLPICGLKNVKALDRARQRAIDAGWLHYEAGSKSKAGAYWTLIARGDLDKDSNATDHDEADLPPGFLGENDIESGKNAGSIRDSNGINAGRIREECGTNVGNYHTYPFPSTPSPIPATARVPETKEPKSPGMSGFTITDPVWDIPSVHAALTLWAQHYPSRRDGAPFTDVQAAILIANKAGEGWTPDVFVKSVRMSAGNGWATIKDYRKIEADAKRQDQSFAPKQPQRTEDVYKPITPPRSRRERQA